MTRDILKEAAFEVGQGIEQGQPVIFKKLSPEDVAILYATAHALYGSGDYEDAEKIFRQLTVCRPLEKDHWHGLGATLQMTKAYEDALTAWSMAALLSSDDPLPHYHAAECLLSINQTEQAMKALREARKYIDIENHDHKSVLSKIEVLERVWQTA